MSMSRQEVARELDKIAKRHGGYCTAEQVLEDSTPDEAPLHDHFEWVEGVAAHQWRLKQARSLLRVTVYLRKTDDGRVRVPVFTSLPSDRGVNGYRPTESILGDPSMLLERDLDVLRRCEAILARANSPRLNPILNALAVLIAKLEDDEDIAA